MGRRHAPGRRHARARRLFARSLAPVASELKWRIWSASWKLELRSRLEAGGGERESQLELRLRLEKKGDLFILFIIIICNEMKWDELVSS